MTGNEKAVCESCGATFDINEPKCPYCGTLNPVGAEKEYSEKLEGIREHLDKVDDIAKDSYIGPLKEGIRAFLIVLLIMSVLYLIWIAGYIQARSKKLSNKREQAEEKIERILLFKENVEKLTSLYESKDYVKACEYIASLEKADKIEIYNWEHYRFFAAYSSLLDSKDYLSKYLESEEKSYYNYGEAIYYFEEFYLNSFKGYFSSDITDEDKAELESIFEAYKEELCINLDIPESDIDAMLEKSEADKFADYSGSMDYARKKVGID